MKNNYRSRFSYSSHKSTKTISLILAALLIFTTLFTNLNGFIAYLSVSAQLAGEVGLTPAAVMNAGFEKTPTGAALPAAASSTIAATRVSGWKSSDTGNIELWNDGFHPGTNANPNNFGNITFYSKPGTGSWFAEINSDTDNASLYQDVYTIPGTIYQWYFDHRGRNGTDAAQMLLGPPSASNATGQLDPELWKQPAASTYYQGTVANYTTSNADVIGAVYGPTSLTPWNYTSMMTASPGDGVKAPNPSIDHTILVAPRGGATPNQAAADNWTPHKGFYIIPAGQTMTRLQMHSAYATYADHRTAANGGKGKNVGNLVDNINFFPVAAPTFQVIYQGDPNPKNATMSFGYNIDANDNAVLDDKGMPTLLAPDKTTPGFVYIPTFTGVTNVSASGNAGYNYTANYGKPYTIDASNNVTAELGLYNVSVAIYSSDPNIVNEYKYDANLSLVATGNKNPGVIQDPSNPSQYIAYVGTIVSQILVLPKHTVSGVVTGLETGPGNSGKTITYMYTYPEIDPLTGLSKGNMLISDFMTVTTDASGNYSFDVPDGATVTITPQRIDEYSCAPNSYTLYNVTSDKPNNNFNYTPIKYPVDVYGTENIAEADTGKGTYAKGETVTLNAGSRPGYTFAGWTVNTGGAVLTDPTSPITTFTMPGTGVTVTANWTPNSTYSIMYSYTGTVPAGAPAVPGIEIGVPSGITKNTATAPTLAGYTFSGWTTVDATVSGGSFVMPAKNVTFVGSWTLTSTYVITYSYTGTIPPSAPAAPTAESNVYSGVTKNVAAAPVLAGYTFSGWTTADATVSGGSFTMPANNVAFVGSWTAVPTYTVTFVDGYSGAVLKTQTGIKSGESATAPANPTRPGYVFDGWDKDFSNITGDLTVTAKWTPILYNITYILKDETTGAETQVFATETDLNNVIYGDVKNVYGDPNVPPNDGNTYTFSGWTTADATVTNGSFTMPANNVTFYGSYLSGPVAQYKIEHYYLDENNNPAVAPFDTATRNGAVGSAVNASSFAKTNVPGHVYAFGTSDTVKQGGTTVLKLYYAPIKYNVAYSYTGTPPTVTPPTLPSGASVSYGSTYTAASAPAMDGYTFDGWYYNGMKVTSLTMPDNDVVLTGSWTAVPTYTVTFVDGYSGAVLKTQPGIKSGGSATAPANPTRPGYVFAGWDVSFSNITHDLTVNAKWTPETTLPPNSGGGGGVQSNTTTAAPTTTEPSSKPEPAVIYDGEKETTTEPTISSSEQETTTTITEAVTSEATDESSSEKLTDAVTEEEYTDVTEMIIPELIINERPTDPTVLEPAQNPTEPAVSEPNNQPSVPTEPANTATRTLTLPENVILLDEMPQDAVKLDDGSFAVPLTDEYWEIFDGNGVPVGVVLLPEGEDITHYNIKENMVPIGNVTLFAKPANEPLNKTAGEIKAEVQKNNPATGDRVSFMFVLFGFMAVSFVICTVLMIRTKLKVK